MELAVLPRVAPSRKTGFLVMTSDGTVALCPFFGKCDGVLIIDPDNGLREFHANSQRTADTMCDVILRLGVQRLVLGFIAGPAARKLLGAGVDIRLGSCACALEHLADCFEALPAPLQTT